MEIYSKNGYFEAIFQLRPFDKRVFEHIMQEISNKKGIFISKQINLKTGVDLYLSSYRFAASLGRQLKKKFGGELKITKSLYGMSRITSKQVYRVTVLFRLKK